jgi:hypothetical protein
MRKTLAALIVLAAGSAVVAHGATSARPLASLGPAVSLPKGTSFAIDRPGSFRYRLVSAPSLSTATATVNSGFSIEGGTATFDSPPHTALRDTADGLEVTMEFTVTSITGSPALVLQGFTVTPR